MPITPLRAATPAAPPPSTKTIGPGSKGPEVRELKTLLRDAGFYKDVINDEMGNAGVSALKEAKRALKLGGAPDVAGATTIAALKKAVASGGAAGDFGAQLKSANLSQTAIYRAIGMAEGTIAANGKPTTAYTQHGDPGNQKLNKGFGSYQVYQHPKGADLTPQEADRVQADRLAAVYPSVDRALSAAGFAPGANRNLIAANALDAWNQAPKVHGGTNGLLNPQRLSELKSAIENGTDPTQAITEWRANGYKTDSGQLDAPGLGNSMSRVIADQERRAVAVKGGLAAVPMSGVSEAPSSSSTAMAGAASLAAGVSTFSPTTGAHPAVQTDNQPLLADGAKGPQVESLQEKLNKLGGQLAVDGDFGPLTQTELRKFQSNNGIASDGIAGPETMRTLDAALARQASPANVGNTSPAMPALNAATLGNLGTASTTSAPFDVRAGSRGPQVTELKTALKQAGFYNGAINDQMGPDGLAALKAAKEKLKLSGDPGVAGPTTMKALKSAATSTSTSTGQVKLPVMAQAWGTDCGLTSVAMIANGLRGTKTDSTQLESRYGYSLLPALEGLGVKAIDHGNLHAEIATEDQAWKIFSNAANKGHPVLFGANNDYAGTHWSGGAGHYMAATGVSEVNGVRMITFNDPNGGVVRTVPFNHLWNAGLRNDGNCVIECS